MASKAPRENIDESKLTVTKPKSKAVGLPAVTNALKISLEQMGPLRSVQTLLAVNQVDGFDCMGCAWPEHDKRHTAEFCENGAKAVAEEATRRRVTPEFFASHSIAELKTRDDYWLGQQGRLTHPMLLDEGATHYRPVEWDDALELIAQEIRDMDNPDQSVFYTPDVKRGGLRLPAPRARRRDQQPSGLFQHVPRVLRFGPRRDHRHR